MLYRKFFSISSKYLLKLLDLFSKELRALITSKIGLMSSLCGLLLDKLKMVLSNNGAVFVGVTRNTFVST